MISPEELKRRHEYIGGSDVPIIMGASKFNKPWNLLLEKALISKKEFGGSVYTEIGNIMEPRIQNAMNLINVMK